MVRRLLNLDRTVSRAVHIDEPGMVDLASFPSSNKKWRLSDLPYANSISETCEDAILANMDGITIDTAWRDPKLKLRRHNFCKWVPKDRFTCDRNVSANEG
jgi:hypothetical protein